jgi:hypothetical protein
MHPTGLCAGFFISSHGARVSIPAFARTGFAQDEPLGRFALGAVIPAVPSLLPWEKGEREAAIGLQLPEIPAFAGTAAWGGVCLGRHLLTEAAAHADGFYAEG